MLGYKLFFALKWLMVDGKATNSSIDVDKRESFFFGQLQEKWQRLNPNRQFLLKFVFELYFSLNLVRIGATQILMLIAGEVGTKSKWAIPPELYFQMAPVARTSTVFWSKHLLRKHLHRKHLQFANIVYLFWRKHISPQQILFPVNSMII